MIRQTMVLLAAALLASTALAQPAARQTPLKAGDKAPALAVSTWVKGDKIDALAPGRVYIVEFWATWCGPCKVSIPHLTKLQAKHRDNGLTVIGVSIWERDTSKVAPFVAEMGAKMDYSIAMDDGTKMSDTWMAAAKRTGIPSAFIINREGLIAWIGNPISPKGEMDEALEKVLAGPFTPKESAELSAKYAAAAAKTREIQARYGRSIASGDVKLALRQLDELIAHDPAGFGAQASAMKFDLLLAQVKDSAAAYAFAKEAASGAYKDDEVVLNSFAWSIVDTPGVETRDYKLALQFAARAVELSAGANAAILDTLARVHFESGNLDEAFRIQTDAVRLADSDLKPQLEATLARYRKALEKRPG